MTAPHVVLASASPRRRELLAQIGVQCEVSPAEIDESVLPGESPQEYVMRIAQTKTRRVAQSRNSNKVVIGADTSVIIDGEILGKPLDQQDFLRMFRLLSGTTHQVLSAVCVQYGDKLFESRLSISRVAFRSLSEDEMQGYWLSGEPADKAGGYAIQGLAAVFVQSISGSYSGIMGLPLFETAELLQQVGFKLPAG